MEEWIKIIAILVILGFGPVTQWWIKRQQKAQEAAKAARRDSAPLSPPSSVSPGPAAGRRTIFYGRSSEMPPRPAPQAPTGPTPLASATRRPPPPTQRRTQGRRPAVAPTPVPPPEETPHALEEVGALAKHHLQQLKPDSVSALSAHHLTAEVEKQVAADLPALAAAKTSDHAHPLFHRDMLRGRNAARAFVLGEIFGPPRAFRDF